MLSSGVGSRREAALTVCGRPRKSAMMSSMFLENFTIGLNVRKKSNYSCWREVGTIHDIVYISSFKSFYFSRVWELG